MCTVVRLQSRKNKRPDFKERCMEHPLESGCFSYAGAVGFPVNNLEFVYHMGYNRYGY